MKKAFVLGMAVLVIAVGAETILASLQEGPPKPDKDRRQNNYEYEVEVERTEKIPTGYKTYSLFLVCNPQWLEHGQGESSDRLNDLYQKFGNFGRVIGDDNLAVWFWISLLPQASPVRPIAVRGFNDNVDVERSVRYCKAWNLKPSAGPHIVVTSTYPDESHLSTLRSRAFGWRSEDGAVFELGNMKSGEISKLLAKLTDELVGKGHVDIAPEKPEAGWVRLLGAVQKTINSFGCSWSFKIDAGPVKADLQSCRP